eukprot:1050490-Rhodomonas_salina.1
MRGTERADGRGAASPAIDEKSRKLAAAKVPARLRVAMPCCEISATYIGQGTYAHTLRCVISAAAGGGFSSLHKGFVPSSTKAVRGTERGRSRRGVALRVCGAEIACGAVRCAVLRACDVTSGTEIASAATDLLCDERY